MIRIPSCVAKIAHKKTVVHLEGKGLGDNRFSPSSFLLNQVALITGCNTGQIEKRGQANK